MKSYLLFTATGVVVILTSYSSIEDAELTNMLASKGIKKFVAHELPLELVKERYGTHFDIVCNDPDQTDEIRILEEDGERAFNMFSFEEMGSPVYHEPK